MDLIKYYSPIEEHEFPDTLFIGYYGITIAGIEEELKNIKDDIIAFNSIIKKRDRLISVNQNLEQYSSKRFIKDDFFQWSEDDIHIEKKTSYSEGKTKYNEFIKCINVNEIGDPIVRTIIEDIKINRYNIDIFSIQDDLINFIKWLENVIRKLSVIIDLTDYQDHDETSNKTEKIVWLKKKEDFVALFDKLFDLGFFPYVNNINQLLAKHFIWPDGEIDSEKLRHVRNNIKNKKETHQISNDLRNLKFDS